MHIADLHGQPRQYELRSLCWWTCSPPLFPIPSRSGQKGSSPPAPAPARVGWAARTGSEGPLLFLPAGVPLGGKPGGPSVATGPCCSGDHKEPAWMLVFGLPPCPCCPHPSNLPGPQPALGEGPQSVPTAPWTPHHFPHLLGGPLLFLGGCLGESPAPSTTAPAEAGAPSQGGPPATALPAEALCPGQGPSPGCTGAPRPAR